MDHEKIKRLIKELVLAIRQPEYLHGSRRWGWISYIKGDLEVEYSSSRFEYKEFSISHPEFLLDYLEPTGYLMDANIWEKKYRITEDDLWFEGDIDALEREVIWLRLSA